MFGLRPLASEMDPTEARTEEHPNRRTRHVSTQGREIKQPGGPPFTCSSSVVGPHSPGARSLERETALAVGIIIYWWDIMNKTTQRSAGSMSHTKGGPFPARKRWKGALRDE